MSVNEESRKLSAFVRDQNDQLWKDIQRDMPVAARTQPPKQFKHTEFVNTTAVDVPAVFDLLASVGISPLIGARYDSPQQRLHISSSIGQLGFRDVNSLQDLALLSKGKRNEIFERSRAIYVADDVGLPPSDPDHPASQKELVEAMEQQQQNLLDDARRVMDARLRAEAVDVDEEDKEDEEEEEQEDEEEEEEEEDDGGVMEEKKDGEVVDESIKSVVEMLFARSSNDDYADLLNTTKSQDRKIVKDSKRPDPPKFGWEKRDKVTDKVSEIDFINTTLYKDAPDDEVRFVKLMMRLYGRGRLFETQGLDEQWITEAAMRRAHRLARIKESFKGIPKYGYYFAYFEVATDIEEDGEETRRYRVNPDLFP
jgi:hypothetical protein